MSLLNNYVKGECLEMCPIEEINLREGERLLHILETLEGTENDNKPKADRKKMVKSFSRSAVGKTMPDSRNLRPPDVLLKTVNYLLNDILSNTKVPWTVTYDFITDRLRSVRQDMVIQNVPVAHSICILQPMVRFHAYASYRLCYESMQNFDPVINKTHLQESLKRLLCLYNEFNTNIKDLVLVKHLKNIRPEFEALYVILNLGSTIALTRAINLPKNWRNDTVMVSIRLSLCYINNNFVRACRLIKKLPILLQAVAILHLPQLRRQAFQIMSVAYNSKNLWFPLKVLEEMLLYENAEDISSDLQHYGLRCKDESVQFLKADFNDKTSTVNPRHLEFVDKKLSKIEITNLIL